MSSSESRQNVKIAVWTIVATLVGTLMGAMLSPYITERFEEKKTPLLVRTIQRTDLQSIPEAVRSQVTIAPIRYTVRHASGGTAKGLRVMVKAEQRLAPTDVVVVSDLEDYSKRDIGDRVVAVDLPQLRPGAEVAIELSRAPHEKVEISEVVETGKVVDVGAVPKNDRRSQWVGTISIVVPVLFLLAVIWASARMVVRGAATMIGVEKEAGPNAMTRLYVAFLISAGFLFCVAARMLPFLPAVSFTDVFCAFALYFLITRLLLRSSTHPTALLWEEKGGKGPVKAADVVGSETGVALAGPTTSA